MEEIFVKPYLIGGFILTGLLLLVWPFAVFASIFIFDAPFRSSLDEAVRYGLAGSILFYPAAWGIALTAAIKTRSKRPKQCAAWIAAPVLWLIIPILLTGIWSNGSQPAWQTKIKDQTTLREIAGLTQDPDYRMRLSAYGALGRRADRLQEPEKRQALDLLVGGLSDREISVQTEASIGLKAFGPYAEPAIKSLLERAPKNPRLIQPLAEIGKDEPSIIIPELLKMVHAANTDGWRSMDAATMSVKALCLYPDHAAEIIPEIKGCSDFTAPGFLGVWLTTMTFLDPNATYYDQGILEHAVVTVLQYNRGGYLPKSKALQALTVVKTLTPNERDCIALVAQNGGTPQLRATAQKLLDNRQAIR
jgi:hypothetical protein